MKHQYIQDIFAFANTAAGKMVAVLVAVLMVLTLSPIAMAAGDLMNEAAAQGSAEGEAQGQGEASGSGLDEGVGNTDGTGGTGDEAGTGDVGGAGDVGDVGDATPASDATLSGAEAAANEAGSDTEGTSSEADAGTGNEAGADDITIDGDIDIDIAIADAITQDTPATEDDAPSGAVDEVSVFFYSENCTIVLNGANVSGSVNMPQFKGFSFTVVPNSGYTVSQVTAGPGGPIAPGIIDAADGVYTIPGEMVTSNLNVSAEAIVDEGAPVEDPTPTTVCDDSTIVAPGTYEAPVITLQDMTRVYTGAAQPQNGYELEFSVEGLQDGDELIISGFEGAGKDARSYQLQVTEYWIKRNVEYDETIPEECQNLDPDVTAEYKPINLSEATATLTIKKAPLYLVTPSMEKEYDGTPLTYSGENGIYGIDDIPDLIADGRPYAYDGPPCLISAINGEEDYPKDLVGDTVYVLFDRFGSEYISVTGSMPIDENDKRLYGSADNTAIIHEDALVDILKNYELDRHTFLGTLTVRPPEGKILIQAPSKSKVYDGAPLKISSSDVHVSGLPEGFTVQVSLTNDTRTDAGTTVVSIDERLLVILNQDGENVTKLYRDDVVLETGTIVVYPTILQVKTDSASSVANGSPLTAGGEMYGLMNGETATLVVTGKQTDVGSSKNTFHVEWNGTANKANYEVVGDVGTLTVTEAQAGGNGGTGTGTTGNGGAGTGAATQVDGPNGANGAAAGAAGGTGSDTGINPAVEAVATAMQNVEQMVRGEETTDLIAPINEEILGDEKTPLGVFDEPVDCWVHWYALLGLLITAIYGAVVMFFRRAYAYELESREANILGAPVGMAQPHVPAGTSGHAGREA